MAGQILASGRQGGGATSINLGAGTPLAGDLLVIITLNGSSGTPVLPSAAAGGGASWTLRWSASRCSCWVGTNPTSVGTLSVTGSTTAMAAFWVRGADGSLVLGSEKFTPDPLAASTLTADAMTAGPTNIVLAVATSSDAMPATGSLPSVPAWTAVAAGTTRSAVATPATADSYAAVTTRSVALRQVLAQVRLGVVVPSAPTDLVVTPVAADSIEVSWTSPGGLGPATGFLLAVNGGTPTDLGNTNTHTLLGLTPSTLYAVDVYAYNAAGTGPAVSGSATTLDIPTPDPPPGGWVAHLRVGEHAWNVLSTDEAEYGPTADLRFSWTAPQDAGWPTQHNPTLLSFGVVVPEGTDFDDVDQGTTVHFTFTPDGYDDGPLVEFGGTVRDLVAQPAEVGMLYRMVAVDHLQKLREDYVTQAHVDAGFPIDDIWDELVKDATGAGMGEGTTPTLPDPLVGQDKPGITSGAFLTDQDYSGNTWEVLTGFLSGIIFRPYRPDPATPVRQRVVLSYQLDDDGDLDAAAPFPGTWMRQGSDDLTTVEVAGGLLPTDSALWTRPRIEPNTVDYGGTVSTRPHTGVDIIRTTPGAHPEWVLSGVDGSSQWASELVLQADRSPATVAGWFTLPAAMNTFVECTGIDARHTPDGSGEYVGLLAGAALAIHPGGTWSVAFALRRTLPEV